MQRRDVLGATGNIATALVLGLSGCVGAPDAGEGTPEGAGTESPGGMETPTPTATATATESPAGGGEQIAAHFRFGGRVQGWQGQEPESIAGTENPTLDLEAGRTYRVTWENLDGVPHDFTIQDGQGNNLAGTEIVAEEGATRTLTFTASEEMALYVCTVHPQTMVGDIRVGGG